MNSELFVSTEYFQHKPVDLKISYQTDIGTDPDDGFGLYVLMQAMKRNDIPQGCLKEIVTTLYNPMQKATIAAKICNYMKCNEIPIYPGFGCTPNKPGDFTDAYPFWPTVWGIPGFTNAVSLGQAKAFDHLPHDPNQIHTETNAVKVIQDTAEQHGANEIILGLTPIPDLAKAIQKCDNINRIILMGGYFGKEVDGKIEISRPGYNTAIDPDASEIILTQTKHPVLIFNSQHVTNWKFSWMQDEILAILCSKEKNPLGEAMAKDFAYYWSNKKPSPFGSLVMADVLTTYVGVLHPELIKSTMPVEFRFNSKTYFNPETKQEEPIHMMHPQAKTLFTVTKKEVGNVHIVTEFTIDPEEMRKKAVEDIVVGLFFNNAESFKQAVEEQKKNPLNQEQIIQLIAQLYPSSHSNL